MLRFVTPYQSEGSEATSLIRVAVEVPADVVANNETLPLDLIFHVPMPIVGGALLTEASQAAQPLLRPRAASHWPASAPGCHLHSCRLRADPRRAQRAAVRGHRHSLPLQRLLRRAGDPHRSAGRLPRSPVLQAGERPAATVLVLPVDHFHRHRRRHPEPPADRHNLPRTAGMWSTPPLDPCSPPHACPAAPLRMVPSHLPSRPAAAPPRAHMLRPGRRSSPAPCSRTWATTR